MEPVILLLMNPKSIPGLISRDCSHCKIGLEILIGLKPEPALPAVCASSKAYDG